jgi:hypothetical protein
VHASNNRHEADRKSAEVAASTTFLYLKFKILFFRKNKENNQLCHKSQGLDVSELLQWVPAIKKAEIFGEA